MEEIIGRASEMAIMEQMAQSKKAELLAIYGRRRVGKTFLVNMYFKTRIILCCIGQIDANSKTQLKNFTAQLNSYFPKKEKYDIPKSWQDAFVLLSDIIRKLKTTEKKVIFFDEVPWLDSHRSGFLSAFGYFWNSFAENRKDLLVIISGSAASWMIRKVIYNKGGLHNRITQKIRLLPFTLLETNLFLKSRKIELSWYQSAQLYMVTGGVAHYLNNVPKGKSLPQIIDHMCFKKDGTLTKEYTMLFPALFAFPENHLKIIAALSKKRTGITRNEISDLSGVTTGGSLTKTLDELEETGFIKQVPPYAKRKQESLFRVIDEFCLFHQKFMNEKQDYQDNYWLSLGVSQAYKSWCGYAFENLIFRHKEELLRALQIKGMATSFSSWYHSGNQVSEVAQIDLLIDRADNCINLCEIKFNEDILTITKSISENLEKKRQIFKSATGTKKVVLITIISPYGISDAQFRSTVDITISLREMFPELTKQKDY
jgi:uncharacterized protein